MPQEYSPTINEERGIGGSKNFGADKFNPTITNLTGDYNLIGSLQRVGRVLYFSILIEGRGGSFTLSSSVLFPPVKPFKRTVNGVANSCVFKGVCFQNGAATSTIMQNNDGTFTLTNETRTGQSTWITGYYWVE